MKNVFMILVISLFLGTTIAEEHAHHHEKKSLSLNNGKKWQVDQTMNENMAKIHSEYLNIQTLIAAKKISAKDYAQLSNLISDCAQKIASNCKMDEKADQTFHVVLADLLTVSEDIKTPKKEKHALEKLHHSLITYTKYFDQSF